MEIKYYTARMYSNIMHVFPFNSGHKQNLFLTLTVFCAKVNPSLLR